MALTLPQPPKENIGENFPWREWFFQVWKKLGAKSAGDTPSVVPIPHAPSSSPIKITGVSPYIFINNYGYDVDIFVNGFGALIEFSRDNILWLDVDLNENFTLSPGDRMRITYVKTPDVYLFPR